MSGVAGNPHDAQDLTQEFFCRLSAARKAVA